MNALNTDDELSDAESQIKTKHENLRPRVSSVLPYQPFVSSLNPCVSKEPMKGKPAALTHSVSVPPE